MTVEIIVTTQIREILAQRGASLVVNSTDNLANDLGFSSLELILLITSVCRDVEFDISQLSDIDLVEMQTVKDIWTRLAAA